VVHLYIITTGETVVTNLRAMISGWHRGNKGIHGLGTRGFVEYYGITQQELLEWTLNKIGQT
jgi:hypothetical protein